MLKTDYKDDIFPGARRYDLVKNEDGTVSFTDKTDYTQEGDKFGAGEINAICQEINETKKSVGDGKKLVAEAITAKGQATDTDAEFAVMAENIGRIETGANQTNRTTHWSGYEDVIVQQNPVDPSQALITIPNKEAGKSYYDSTSKISGNVANLNADNIKSGVKVGRSGAHGADSTNTITGTFTSDATATASQILQGCTAYVKGNKITGTMPKEGAKTITPGTASQLAIEAGTYAEGRIFVEGDGNLVPWNIKKGVTIFGKKGTWSGWVPEPTDLYLYGNNSSGFYTNNGNYYTFDSGQISVKFQYNPNIGVFSQPLELSGFSFVYVDFEILYVSVTPSSWQSLLTVITTPGEVNQNVTSRALKKGTTIGRKTMELDIKNVNAVRHIGFSLINVNANIYRIWLS